MTQTKRIAAPPIEMPSHIELPRYEIIPGHNHTDIHIVEGKGRRVSRIEIVFPAGKTSEQKKMTAFFTGLLLKEGTSSKSSSRIAGMLDYLGATINAVPGPDTCTVSAFFLSSTYKEVIDILSSIILDPAFDNNELDIQKTIQAQTLSVNQEKVEYLASKKFLEILFGKDHPYGYSATIEYIDNIERKDLTAHHKKVFLNQAPIVFISGNLEQGLVPYLNKQLLVHLNPQKAAFSVIADIQEQADNPKDQIIERPESKQSAIRSGRILFTNNHPDYNRMKILNTVLGGYFGSRLMTNIREDKGFTYGIQSTVHNFINNGALYISTDVGNQYTSATMFEINNELNRLKTEIIPEGELNLVKNYLLGNILNQMDGPFKKCDLIKSHVVSGLKLDNFAEYMDLIRSISGVELKEMANKYLNPEEMITVIAGSK